MGLAANAAWREEDHPRDDGGRFTDGPGGGGSGGEKPKPGSRRGGRVFVMDPPGAPKGAKIYTDKHGNQFFLSRDRRLKLPKGPPIPHDKVPLGGSIKDYAAFTQSYLRPAVEAINTIAEALPDRSEQHIYGRVKSPTSLKEKVEVRKKTGSLHDVIGVTALADTADDVASVVDAIEGAGLKIVEHDDRFMKDPGMGYYRATHLIVEHDGVPFELQVMSWRMSKLKLWAHPKLYKGGMGEEVLTYTQDLARFIEAIEDGERPDTETVKCPGVLSESGDCFPIEEVT